MGPVDASIVVIGEAPGYKEAQEGKPFQGPSGKLLDQVLGHHGIDRNAVYVDNVCACRPKENRTPTAAEVKACWPRVRDAVEKIQPQAIIALGNTATQATLQQNINITAARVGPPKRCDQFPGVDIIPTFHPAACLYAADNFPHLVTDIGKVLPQSRIKWEPPTYAVFEDWQEGIKALRQLADLKQPLAIDIEVGIDKEIHFGHPEHYTMLCIGISYAPGKAVVFGEECCSHSSFIFEFRQLYRQTKWIAHNGKFDMAGLNSYADAEGELVFDTMLASYVLDERPGTHGLKYLATELLGAPDYAADLSRYVGKGDSYAIVPRPILYEYNAMDVSCTWTLYEKYNEDMNETERKLHDFLVDLSPVLMAAEMEGVLIDDEYNQQLVESYLGTLDELEKELIPWVKNPRSPKQVKEALYDMGLRVASTNEDTLVHILEKVAPDSDTAKFVRGMLRHRREAKLYGTYVKGIRKRMHRGRIHSSFLLHGTTTGRPASRNPNLFNIPRESSIRAQFIPEPGNVFVQADYATAELRVMAVEAGDEFLASIFAEGRDIHNEFSLVFYGPDFTKDQRVRTKAFVFGTAYGREAFSVAMEHGIPISEAERNQKILYDSMPQVAEWQQRTLDIVFKSDDDIETRFGRKRRFWLITEANKKDVKNQALAFIPQSTASDICATALLRLRRDHGLATRISVYDSILVECAADLADDTSALMVRVMEDTARDLMGDSVPFPVDVKIGSNWGEV